MKNEDGDEEHVVLSAFPAESNGGDDTVGTNGQPIPEYTLLFSALLCRGSSISAVDLSSGQVRPQCRYVGLPARPPLTNAAAYSLAQ